MSLKQRVLKGDAISVLAGPSLLESLWAELLKEWKDPDDSGTSDFDAGYITGLAYAIAKIEMPYADALSRTENVIKRARVQNSEVNI